MIEGVPVYGQIWCPNLLLNLMLQLWLSLVSQSLCQVYYVIIYTVKIWCPNLYG